VLVHSAASPVIGRLSVGRAEGGGADRNRWLQGGWLVVSADAALLALRFTVVEDLVT
jgi:hypothetical protein